MKLMNICSVIAKLLSIISSMINPVFDVDKYVYPNKTMGNCYLSKC